MTQFHNLLVDRITTDEELKISDIPIVGSHDSSSYKIDHSVQLDGDMCDLVNKTRKLLRPMNIDPLRIDSVFSAFTITQHKTIYEQLACGIRFLDLRVTVFGNEFYCSHTLANININIALDDIVRFLTSDGTENEYIIIRIRRDSSNNPPTTKNIISHIARNHPISQFISFDEIQNVNYPSDLKKERVYIYNEMKQMTKSTSSIWNGNAVASDLFPIFNPWPNTINIDKSIQYNKNEFEKQFQTNNTTLNILGIVLTPDDDQIILAITSHVLVFISIFITSLFVSTVLIKQVIRRKNTTLCDYDDEHYADGEKDEEKLEKLLNSTNSRTSIKIKVMYIIIGIIFVSAIVSSVLYSRYSSIYSKNDECFEQYIDELSSNPSDFSSVKVFNIDFANEHKIYDLIQTIDSRTSY